MPIVRTIKTLRKFTHNKLSISPLAKKYVLMYLARDRTKGVASEILIGIRECVSSVSISTDETTLFTELTRLMYKEDMCQSSLHMYQLLSLIMQSGLYLRWINFMSFRERNWCFHLSIYIKAVERHNANILGDHTFIARLRDRPHRYWRSNYDRITQPREFAKDSLDHLLDFQNSLWDRITTFRDLNNLIRSNPSVAQYFNSLASLPTYEKVIRHTVMASSLYSRRWDSLSSSEDVRELLLQLHVINRFKASEINKLRERIETLSKDPMRSIIDMNLLNQLFQVVLAEHYRRSWS